MVAVSPYCRKTYVIVRRFAAIRLLSPNLHGFLYKADRNVSL